MTGAEALAAAEEAVRLIHRDPQRASALAGSIVHSDAPPNDANHLNALALAYAVTGRLNIDLGALAVSTEHLDKALDMATSSEIDSSTRAYVQLTTATLAVAEGRLRDALSLVDAALTVPTNHHGNARVQRGLILQRLGDTVDAIREYDAAEPLLRESETVVRIRLLLNRGTAHAQLGRLADATADLGRARDLAMNNEMYLLAAKATHNLGYVAAQRADLVAALNWYSLAESAYRHAGASAAVLAADRGAALAAAGLFREATSELTIAVRDLESRGLAGDCTDARVQIVRLALATGDTLAASATAARAEQEFSDQGRPRWASVAKGYRLVAAHRLPRRRPTEQLLRAGALPVEPTDADDAAFALLATELGELGWGSLAWALRSTLACRLGDRGDAPAAEAILSPAFEATGFEVADTGEDPSTDVAARLAYGEAQIQRHRIAGRLQNARAAFGECIALLDLHRSRTGSSELRARATALARDVLEAGLRAELSIGDSTGAVRALDAYRDATMRLWPLRANDESGTTAIATSASISAVPFAAESRLRAETDLIIQDRIRPASQRLEPRSVLELDVVELPNRFASFVVRRGTVEVFVGEGREIEHRQLGDLDEVLPAIERARSLLITAFEAGSRGERARRRLQAECEDLTEFLLGGIRSSSDETLVVVPDPTIANCPWGLLTGLRNQSFVVAPSLKAAYRRRPTRSSSDTTALIAGPNLLGASREIAALAERQSASVVLSGSTATVASTLHALATSDTVHIAAHGRFRDDHPLLSGIELADGTLFGYDIDSLDRCASLVVLSACGTGQEESQDGTHLGLATVLLARGTATVVAPLLDVPDEFTVDVMIGFHEALKTRTPAAALALLRMSDDLLLGLAASCFVAIGCAPLPPPVVDETSS